ncbi:flagellar outer dynein arm light chain 6 [Micromonas pusilla CCMP1545]|uniref:Dynein light chain n=2 Tax=Micromonas pusilla TaxID=38833 RepID=C1MWA5_MICPC|nr:flagellar outer dynein arm light chain 6 [Micromonas pusilla CCMP1545]EEH56133.1 flagellar outer dynein arm light chain 6 [Micromonas pusilla CCMP1545]|mmetsp:Transcript_10973/g.39699  ORF Transcript_10973/g.39699 Transcript_10973/m.39699 type:complete len:121 (+) Transcript_10973:216-578(+)|eukprot:XP_003060181.1 flagellar outer dynein arm light chain 6 [Micromonas pusilla CCMP1545]
MADKKAPEETEEKTQAKEHDVSIVLSYMDDEHEKAAIEVACAAFDKFTQYKDVAQCIKKEYDARYPSTGKATDGVYHAVVGKHFGASFSHETNSYVHLKVDLNNVVVFKSKDSPFDIDQP